MSDIESDYLNILGVRIHPVNIAKVIDSIDNLIQRNDKGYITVTGVHGIMESLKSLTIQRAHNNSSLTVPDGMPLVYIGKLYGHREISRCYGPDLMSAIMKHSLKKDYTHFFYGGGEGVAEDLKISMEKRFPGIQIVGIHTPPFRPLRRGEKEELIGIVKEKKPNFFWVGLSTPKQELFMYEFMNLLETNVMLGVGAAFDFHTGRIKSAPRWMQRCALEWFYRVIQEPKRLWKRYFINNPLFLWNLALQISNMKKFKMEV